MKIAQVDEIEISVSEREARWLLRTLMECDSVEARAASAMIDGVIRDKWGSE